MSGNIQYMNLRRYKNVVVLTGAGVSVASGLRTYRGPGGLWEESGVAPQATARAMRDDPWSVWEFFIPLMERMSKADPNPAHRALAELERHGFESFTLVTQNVDGLHQQAGSKNLLEYHGSLLRRRCSRPACRLHPYQDFSIPSSLPHCELCGSPLRPDIVLFGEQIPALAGHQAKRALRTVDLFLAIGTSGTVAPACNFVRSADYAGARTVEFNLHSSGLFHKTIEGPVEETLPEFLSRGIE